MIFSKSQDVILVSHSATQPAKSRPNSFCKFSPGGTTEAATASQQRCSVGDVGETNLGRWEARAIPQHRTHPRVESNIIVAGSWGENKVQSWGLPALVIYIHAPCYRSGTICFRLICFSARIIVYGSNDSVLGSNQAKTSMTMVALGLVTSTRPVRLRDPRGG
jgi:hypothetical protein